MKRTTTFMALLVAMAMTCEAGAVRIKDLANVKGVRSNHLTGYGIVVGLDGTGDGNSQLTSQAMAKLPASEIARRIQRPVPPDPRTSGSTIDQIAKPRTMAVGYTEAFIRDPLSRPASSAGRISLRESPLGVTFALSCVAMAKKREIS